MLQKNPSVQWKWWEESHHRTGRSKASSSLLLGSKTEIQALLNAEAEMSFKWLNGWMAAAKACS